MAKNLPDNLLDTLSNTNRGAGFAFEKAAPGCAHNLCAVCAQIPHLPGVGCFVRGRSVQKKCQWHFFSVGRSGYAARGNHVGRIACGRELYEAFDSL